MDGDVPVASKSAISRSGTRADVVDEFHAVGSTVVIGEALPSSTRDGSRSTPREWLSGCSSSAAILAAPRPSESTPCAPIFSRLHLLHDVVAPPPSARRHARSGNLKNSHGKRESPQGPCGRLHSAVFHTGLPFMPIESHSAGTCRRSRKLPVCLWPSVVERDLIQPINYPTVPSGR